MLTFYSSFFIFIIFHDNFIANFHYFISIVNFPNWILLIINFYLYCLLFCFYTLSFSTLFTAWLMYHLISVIDIFASLSFITTHLLLFLHSLFYTLHKNVFIFPLFWILTNLQNSIPHFEGLILYSTLLILMKITMNVLLYIFCLKLTFYPILLF